MSPSANALDSAKGSAKSQLFKPVPSSMANRTPLYIQMEQKANEMEKGTLEEKKKRLEEIRALHKPLEKQDLMEHALNYERIRQEKE